MTRPFYSGALQLALALLLTASWFACPVIAEAQQATQYRPDRVRAMMTSIHGYTREGLEGASSNVDEILMMLAADDQEQMLVRRQAIKGLRLYTTADVLSFIEQNSAAAPESLKRLYLSSAAGFAGAFPARVQALAEANLNDSEVNVRFSALKLSDALRATPQLTTMLQSRLALESDAGLRAAIQRRLGAN